MSDGSEGMEGSTMGGRERQRTTRGLGRGKVRNLVRLASRSGVLHTRGGWGTAPQDHEVVRTRGSEGEARRGPASLPSPRRSPRTAGPALSGARPSISRHRLSVGGNWRSEGEGGHGPAIRRPGGGHAVRARARKCGNRALAGAGCHARSTCGARRRAPAPVPGLRPAFGT